MIVPSIQCDRCGKMYTEQNEEWRIMYRPSNGALAERKDLCPDCMAKFLLFIRREKESA